ALFFDFDTMQAPKVLAKGRNLHAERIKQTARWAGVPIIENPPLARSLYKSVEPGQSIPHDLYAAVAAILAFLYRQRMAEKMREEEQQRARERTRKQHTRAQRGQGAAGQAGASGNTGTGGKAGAAPAMQIPQLPASSGVQAADRNDDGNDEGEQQ
ncbi:MAG TPA: EscU/YscU/HrcU family type III secretion system export apparatus switch protein, partial [Acidobacteriaceae bacterium]|nr:EscU/YscU/HrcU family type III secretion system export apparatus switch protein [Acidobacteriaceae bacterium]